MVAVLAIDPGSDNSGLVYWNGSEVQVTRFMDNDTILEYLRTWKETSGCPLAIEMIESFGLAVGAETFRTCIWIGRFMQVYGVARTHLVTRRQVKLNLCGSARARDADVRQAILDLFGGKQKAIGKRAAPGPLHGVTGHCWQALAVALTWQDDQTGVGRHHGATS